jgi:hypothetical protein
MRQGTLTRGRKKGGTRQLAGAAEKVARFQENIVKFLVSI